MTLYETKGGALLRLKLDGPRRMMSRVELAECLGISHVAVGAWCRLTSRPRHVYRVAIERLLGIRVESWLLPEERAELARLRPSRVAGASRVRPAVGAAE